MLLSPETEAVVRAAQQGDPASFTMFFELHYAGMLAVATRILGPRPDAEDACQDAAITALARLSELRDPGSARAWLHTIVRNNCRDVLRARKTVPVGVAGEHLIAPEADDPEARLDRAAMSDWIRHALHQVSPGARTVAMLRYFTGNNSYEQIAALCDLPIGTVRSRLHEARRQLARVLPQVRDEWHGEAAALNAERREEAATILSAVVNSVPIGRVDSRWAEDMTMHWPDEIRSTGLKSIFRTLRNDYEAGVTNRLIGVVAGPGVTIWDHAFINPPENPEHCPPGATCLLREEEGLVREVRLLLTPRPEPGCRFMPR